MWVIKMSKPTRQLRLVLLGSRLKMGPLTFERFALLSSLAVEIIGRRII